MNIPPGMQFVPSPESQQNMLPEHQVKDRTKWQKKPPEGVEVPPAQPLSPSDFLKSDHVMKIPVE